MLSEYFICNSNNFTINFHFIKFILTDIFRYVTIHIEIEPNILIKFDKLNNKWYTKKKSNLEIHKIRTKRSLVSLDNFAYQNY